MTKGEMLRQLRESQGLKLVDAAERAGTTKQNLYKYENDVVKNIPPDKIEALAAIYGVHPSAIMGWEKDGLWGKLHLKTDSTEAMLIGLYRRHPEIYRIAEQYAHASHERRQIIRDLLRL